MNATASAPGILLARNACQRARDFFCGPRAEGEKKARDNKSAAMARQIENQLDLALAASFDIAAFEHIGAIVMAAPGIDQCFIQQTISLDKEPVGKVPGGAGAYVYGHFIRDQYRVFLHTGKPASTKENTFVEVTHKDLLTAVREAFTALGMPVPKALA